MRNHNHSFRSLLLLLLAGICLSSTARANDTNVTLYKMPKGNLIYLMVRLTRCSEATVTYSATIENMTSSLPLPQTVTVKGPGSSVLAVFTPINLDQPYSCHGSYTWEYGHRLTGSPSAYNYLLPYRDGPFLVIQGAHGSFSHNVGTEDAEAIDWAMPAGTAIYPARPGVVIGFRTDCTIGGTDKKLMADCNYVVLQHDDGTMAEYVHLQHNGVLVRLGDYVTSNQPIALSGNTGYTTEPHLHFAVFAVSAGSGSESIPITFLGSNGIAYTPTEGSFY